MERSTLPQSSCDVMIPFPDNNVLEIVVPCRLPGTTGNRHTPPSPLSPFPLAFMSHSAEILSRLLF